MAAEDETNLKHAEHSASTSYMDDKATEEQDLERQSTNGKNGNAEAESPEPKDPNIVSWAVDDPENPMNWPARKKVGVVVVVAFITMLS